ncbi:unnamed protein product [Ambrosiozyma monospora]|uniref:Unnamed protein product n=1 Tax=Ambrosiozyma monospora TaxID=43982 RepID=A0ACB5TBD3_AMBMO|nr:unnamed protein product [Ambrosiozyma monospora]
MDYDETPTHKPNIFKKTWGSLFGSENTNSSSTPNTELFQQTQQSSSTTESNDQFNHSGSVNYDDITGLNTYRNTCVANDNDNYDNDGGNDPEYEVSNGYDSRARASSMGSGIRMPSMTPTSTSQNSSFAFGDMGGHFMNGGGHRRFNSYSYGSTVSGYGNGGGNVFNNGSGYSYDNSPVAYGMDEKTMNTLSLINKSRARWGLTESQQRGGTGGGMIGGFPFSGAGSGRSGFPEPPVMNKDGLDLLLKRVQENNKRIDALVSVKET